MEKAPHTSFSGAMNNQSIDHLFPDDRHADPDASTLRRIQLVELRILKIIDRICTIHGLKYWLDGGTLLGAVRYQGFIPWDDDIDIVMPRRDFQRFIDIAHTTLPDDLEIDTSANSGNERGFNVPCRIRDRFSIIVETHSADNLGQGLFVDIVPSDIYHTRPPLLSLELAYRKLYSNSTKVYDLFRNIRRRKIGFWGVIFNILPLVPAARASVRLLNWFSRRFLLGTKFQREEIGFPGYGYDVRWLRIFKREDIFPLRRLRFEGTEFLAPQNPDGVLRIFYGADYMIPPERSGRTSKHLRALVLDIRLDSTPSKVNDVE